MEKLSENELQYYNSLDVWTPIQAVAVINSIKPESLSFPLPEEIKLQLNVIYSAWEGRHFQNGCMGLFIKLPLKNPEYRNMIPEFISLEHDGYGMYDREDALIHLNVKAFKKWMVGKEIFPTLSIQCSMENGKAILPSEAQGAALMNEKIKKHSPRPEDQKKNILHIDLDHPNLSEELKISLQAWEAVYVGGERNDKSGHLDNIKAWLKKTHPSLTKNAQTRIATVVNPNKVGGSPPSSSDQ